MSVISSINPKAARNSPETEFASPAALVAAPGLTRGQKIAALLRWRDLLERRIAATSEGMPSNGTADEDTVSLEAVGSALTEIQTPRPAQDGQS